MHVRCHIREFLGHMVSESGINPLPRHVTAIQEFPQPTDIKQLQQFLGLVNFSRGFCRLWPRHSNHCWTCYEAVRNGWSGHSKRMQHSPPRKPHSSPQYHSHTRHRVRPSHSRLTRPTHMSERPSNNWKTVHGTH